MTRIFQICNSYESGFGHGYNIDGLDLSKTPHSDTELGEAYQIGYDAGKEAFLEQNMPKQQVPLIWPEEIPLPDKAFLSRENFEKEYFCSFDRETQK